MQPRLTAWMRFVRSTLSDGRLAFLLIAAFALFNLIGLDRVPLVSGDEPWIAEPGYQFWQGGTLVSELHRGFAGVERHFVLHAPFFTIIVGGVIWLFGLGLVEVRLVSLSMAAATAALTYFLGRRLLSPRHGLLAALALTTWPITPGLPFRPSGIPLVDLGRLARYDIAVPVGGVTAFLLILPLLTSGRVSPWPDSTAPSGVSGVPVALPRSRLVLAGACAGLAVLCHPTGLAWVAILCTALLVARGRFADVQACGWVLAGTLAALLPYIRFVYDGWDDFVGQQRYVAERYDVLNIWFYLGNVLGEWRRYSQIGRGLLNAQPGAWLIVICGITGLWALWRGRQRHDLRVRLLRTALLIGVALFALGLRPKYYHYVAAIWPLLALTVAMGLVTLLGAPSRVIRLAAIVMVILTVADGAWGWMRLAQSAASATPYRVLCDRLAAELPRDTRLLAMPQYWFGLAPRVQEYRSMLVPVLAASRRFASQSGTLEDALAAVGANVILLDGPMLTLPDQKLDPKNPAHGYAIAAKRLRDYLTQHSARHVVLDDPSYGRFEIHYLHPRNATATAPP